MKFNRFTSCTFEMSIYIWPNILKKYKFIHMDNELGEEVEVEGVGGGFVL